MHSRKSVRVSSTFPNTLYFCFLPNFTHTLLVLGDTQGARFYDKHRTTLHLFVILFPVQYMEKRFALETRGKLFDKK